MRIDYARVSTTEQNLDLQRDALKRSGCERIIEEMGGQEDQGIGFHRVTGKSCTDDPAPRHY
jgi:DNA invertase Pin-like site-specific DNA recombinase